MSARFVAGKVAGAVATLLFVLVVNFFLFRVVQDNPIESMFRGRNLTDQQIARLEERFGLDQPQIVQFGKFVRETVTGNLGISIETSRPVTSEIADALWPTIWLVGLSTTLSMVIGVWLGISAAWSRGSPKDVAMTSGSMFTYSVPDFWLGMLLLGFLSFKFHLFPTGGYEDAGTSASGLSLFLDRAHHMVLPCLTLTLAYIGEYFIVTRASVIDSSREDYLTLARAKGLADRLVRRRHAVPNAMLPVVSLSALNFGFVLSGAIAVESIFSWPGLGLRTADAIRGPDLPMLQGLFLLFSAAVIVANLIADLLYGYLDPRVRRT